MSEADWWLCPECSSLNNLHARKCYSCRKRKPKGAVKASEVLGYYPVVSWDGKVTLVKPMDAKPTEPVEAAPAVSEGQAKAALEASPLREPVRRSIAALTPQYPEPVRATYSDAPPPPMAVPPPMPVPMGPVPTGPVGPVAGPVPAGPVPLAGPPLPMGPTGPVPLAAPPGPMGPAPPGVVPPPPNAGSGFAGAPPRPMVPMGPGPGAVPTAAVPTAAGPSAGAVAYQFRQPVPIGPAPGAPEPPPPMPPAGEQWPHWRELLDGPTPQAERLRVHSEDAALAVRLSGTGPIFWPDGDAPLAKAMRQAQADPPSPGFVPWPEADRLPEPEDGASEVLEPPPENS